MTEDYYRKTLRNWLYGRTSDTFNSTPTSVLCSLPLERNLISMMTTTCTAKKDSHACKSLDNADMYQNAKFIIKEELILKHTVMNLSGFNSRVETNTLA